MGKKKRGKRLVRGGRSRGFSVVVLSCEDPNCIIHQVFAWVEEAGRESEQPPACNGRPFGTSPGTSRDGQWEPT